MRVVGAVVVSSTKHMTNTEAIVEIMECSNFGALAQIFLLDALTRQGKAVAELPGEALPSMRNGFCSPEEWQGVAREISRKVEQHLGFSLPPLAGHDRETSSRSSSKLHTRGQNWRKAPRCQPNADSEMMPNDSSR
jgi:hypothetical protein